MPRAVREKTGAIPKPKGKVKKFNGYKFPEKFPNGEILVDNAKKEWIIGNSIGQGGFGEIYSASSGDASNDQNSYVIKIEPHGNGPLFVEMHFYVKVIKKDDVEEWKKKHRLQNLGLPTFYGSGSHLYKNEKYRFLVIERYGKNLWNLFLENGRKFPEAAVYNCAIQIIDALQYIHSCGYVHLDVKGANLLLGLKKGTENNVYLLDFGLACKYNRKEFKRDPKKAHNGTIEYCCRDLHMGVPTRRGDMEILGFNLLHWLGSSLPWDKYLSDPEKVFEKKKELMENLQPLLGKQYPQLPKVIVQYLDYVAGLDYNEEPDYAYCKNLFVGALKPFSTKGKLDFTITEKPISKNSKALKRKSLLMNENMSAADDAKLDIAEVKKHKTDVAKETESKKSDEKKGRKRNATTEVKLSWKNAPTIKASNVTKAGEYVKKQRSAANRKTTNPVS